MSIKLYVGNISFNMTENDLNDLFAQHGPVTEVNIIMDKMSGRSRGFGFVTMENPDQGRAAIEALNGVEISGRAIVVNEARPREDRPHGGGGFGGGHGGGGGHREGGGFRGGHRGGGREGGFRGGRR